MSKESLASPATASGWIPIFKGGKQTDSAGREHDGNTLIDKAVSTFNAKEHEPPAVIGHPHDNAPAWGWVQGLKREGDLLLAQFKDLVPEFKDMVNKGMFKKRSASFYPDGRLRHVGFLGAMPPAVKGLPDAAFKEGDGMCFDFVEEIINPEKQESSMTGKTTDVETHGNASLQAEFAEKSRADAQRIADLETQLKKEKEERVKADIASFVEGLKKDGRYLPAWDKMGMVAFMQKLDAEPIEFAEGKKQTPLEFVKGFLSGLPQFVNFKEISDGEELPEGEEKREALVKNFMESNKVTYRQALIEVSKKHPQLFK